MQFLWHDYETFGTAPAVDRPCQFAAQRTDSELEAVGEPVVMYCAPADDVLPRPGACLVTGITPQLARREGIREAEFASAILDLMAVPGTCSAGYNSLKFDDEVTRHLLYRNLYDPYEREWKNGNSRWDLINLARMCYALRPEGIEWPLVEPDEAPATDAPGSSNTGPRPSFRLEDLARANDIGHGAAHEALSDVRATIDLARLIKQAQPKLFLWSLGMRDKKRTRDMLNPDAATPVVHTSGRIASSRGCTTLILPLAEHPDNDKAVIVFDLMGDADALIDCDSDAVRDRVFTPAADLPDHVGRLPLKVVKWNAVPMLAPAGVLTGVDLERIGLDRARCERNAALVTKHIQTVRRVVRAAFHVEYDDADTDPELALYGGGFFEDSDRRLMRAIHDCAPAELAEREWHFRDPRLPRLLLRYRARNWPESLSQSDWDAWEQDRIERLTGPADAKFYSAEAFGIELKQMRAMLGSDPDSARILDALEDWFSGLGLEAHISNL